MLKTKAKIIITVVIALIAIWLFNTNTVSAVQVTETYLQEIIDSIPDTMKLDIPEVEYKKANEIILTNVKNILKNNGMQYEDTQYGIRLKDAMIDEYNIEINSSASPIYLGRDEFYKAYISIEAVKDNTSYGNYTKSKIIQLIYNNSDDYNKEDEAYVKKLKIESPKYYEVDLDFLVPDDSGWYKVWDNQFKIIGEYYTNLINDSSIVVGADSGAGGSDGGLNLWTWESGTYIGIFKDEILYDIRKMGQECTVPVITVPNTVEEKKINDYVIELITKYYKEFGENITKIEKGTKDVLEIDIPNGYTVYSNYGMESCIIIKIDNKIQEIIDSIIPDTIKLDIPEVEYKKAEELVIKNIKEILENKAIKYEVVEGNNNHTSIKLIVNEYEIIFDISSVSPLYGELDEFYKANININVVKGNATNSDYSKSKKIQLVYNNHNNYNSKDEAYVKKLKIETPRYFEAPFDYLTNDVGEYWNKITRKYLDKIIKDESITYEVSCDGGGAYISLEMMPNIALFKNGVLYDFRTLDIIPVVTVINIPRTIKNDGINDYVVNLIEETYTDLKNQIISIEKGCTGSDSEAYANIPNIYTLTWKLDGINEYIMIKKEKTIASKEEKTKIKFETTTQVVPEDTQIVVDEIKEEKTIKIIKESLKEVSDKYVVFDISLISKEEKIQPNGKVKISIPVPNEFDESNLIVYRIEENGTKKEFKVEIVEIDNIKYAQFETEHFSNYVLAEKMAENDTKPELIPETTTDEDESSTERVLDNQPKTGRIDTKLSIGIILIVLIIGIVISKRKSR